MDLSAEISLKRAESYASPRRASALLPLVYGDMTLGPGQAGFWRAVCLDTELFVYALAGHALLPLEEGNEVTLYDGEDQVINPGLYSLNLNHDFQGRGAIATASFAEDARELEPITVRALGAFDGQGVLQNPVDIARHLLTQHCASEEDDLDVGAFNRARWRAEALGLSAAGLVHESVSAGDALTGLMSSFLGSWWQGGDGRLKLSLDLGAGSLAESDVAAALREGDLSQVSVGARLADMVNRARVSYCRDYMSGDCLAQFDGLDTQDLRAQTLHGLAETTLQLGWVRSAQVARTLSQRLVALLGRPRRVISCQENSLANLVLEKGDAVLLGLSWLCDTEGLPLKNQIVRVLGLEPDLAGGTITYSLLDTGLYKSLAALADGSLAAGGLALAGGARDCGEY